MTSSLVSKSPEKWPGGGRGCGRCPDIRPESGRWLGGALLVVLAAGCTSQRPTTRGPAAAAAPQKVRTCGGAAEASEAPRSVRDVDWCNHEYEGDIPGMFGEGARLGVHGGMTYEHVYGCPVEGEHTSQDWTIGEVAYGDIDRDGVEDAAIVLDYHAYWCSEGGTEKLRAVLLQTVRDGRAVPLCTLQLERGEALRIAFADGDLAVTHENGRTGRWRWDDAAGCAARLTADPR